MKVTEAKKITDSLTRTSKMPGLSYSLPAWACQTGSKLRKVKTSPCYGCYALKGNYKRYPAIKAAQYRSWTQSITLDGLKLWPRKLSGKNILDGMMPGTFNQSSICKKLLKCVSSRLTPNTGYQLKKGNTCRSLKTFQLI